VEEEWTVLRNIFLLFGVCQKRPQKENRYGLLP